MRLGFRFQSIARREDGYQITPQRFVVLCSRLRVTVSKSHQRVACRRRIVGRQIARYFIDNNQAVDRFNFGQAFVKRNFVAKLCPKLTCLIGQYGHFTRDRGQQRSRLVQPIDLTEISSYISNLTENRVDPLFEIRNYLPL